MAVNFPNSPTDQQTFISSGRTYRFNGTSSIWEVVQGTTTTDYNNLTNKPTVPTDVSDLTDTTSLLGSGGVTAYANLAAFPSSGNTVGDFGFDQATGGLYNWSGSAWKRIYSGADESPTWTTEPPATANLSTDGSATNQTVAATDPEGFPITYSHDTNPSNQTQATITNTGGDFTITPSTDLALSLIHI